MSNQYFENNEQLLSKQTEIIHYYLSHKIKLTTDLGVFSKSAVDEGTRILLKNIPTKYQNKTILDVGCGYGTIGLSIAVNNPTSYVTMIDVNHRAIDLSKKNALDNDIQNVEIFLSDKYENITKTYDVIVTNPPIRAGKDVVLEILCNAYAYLNEDGVLYFVMRKSHGLESAVKALEKKFKTVSIITKDSGYSVVKASKK